MTITIEGITALEMATLLKGPLARGLDDAATGLVAGWPEYSATQIGQVLKDATAFPGATRSEMSTALLGAGFDPAQVSAALTALYGRRAVSVRTVGPAGETGPDSWSDWPGAKDKGSITNVDVRHGDIVDNIRVSYGADQMPGHGGTGGAVTSFALDPGDVLAEVHGVTGTWFGSDSVLQVGFISAAGKTYGPFGTMRYATSQTPFRFAVETGEELIALHGSYRPGVQADGQQTFFMNGLGSVFAVSAWKFVPHMDSPGNDVGQLGAGLSIAEMKAKAEAMPEVLAFNSNGWFKHTVQLPQQWSRWTENASLGLYVKVGETT